MVLIGAAITLPVDPGLVLYFVSLVMAVLLFTSIRNAWDLVTYLTLERSHAENKNP